MSESTGDVDAVVTVVVLVRERPEELAGLYREFAPALRGMGRPFEFIFATEPWYRELAEALEPLIEEGEPIRVVEAGERNTDAALVTAAAGKARGEVVVTLPSYRRVRPSALPELIRTLDEGADVAVARRWPRRDPWVNRLQGWLFHHLLQGIGGARFHDLGSGVRALRREVLDEVPLYGDFHRFQPLMAAREGYRVEEVRCEQHPEDRGTRLYGPGVYVRRLLDLFGVFFLLRFTDKPLRFFGLVGTALGGGGGAILLLMLVQRLGGQPIANRPLLLLGLLLVVLGIQAVALGLIGEIIVHMHATNRRRHPYRIAEEGESSPEAPDGSGAEDGAVPGSADG